MPTPISPRLQNRCIEAIALLSYLGKNYAPPQKYLNEDPNTRAGGSHKFRYKDERHISSTLAYLSCIGDEVESATAVCVRDTPEGLCVMIAVNANSAGPSPYLNSVKAGFDKIFDILRTVSINSRESILERLFISIVTLCRQRIITRARLGNDLSRPNLEESLKTLKMGLSSLPTEEGDSGLVDLITTLISMLDRYRRDYLHAAPQHLQQEEEDDVEPDRDRSLEKIVDKCYQISRIEKLDNIFQQAFDQITPRVNPLMPPALLDRIRKIAVYKKSASTLYELARRYPSVRRASTLIISPKADAFPQPSQDDTPTLLEVLQRISQSHQTPWIPQQAQKTISERLQKNPSAFIPIIKNTKADAKVHAEIQLVWYLEEHRREMGESLPRIISPSREACYLCNHFIRSLTDYNIPGTHGRLYHLWTLPPNNPREIDYQHFVMDLERTAIKQIVDISQNKIQKLQQPAESPAPSTMSVKSRAPALNGPLPESPKVSEVKPAPSESRVSETKHAVPGSRVSSAKPMSLESRVSSAKLIMTKSHVSSEKPMAPESRVSSAKPMTPRSRASSAKPMSPESRISSGKFMATKSHVSSEKPLAPGSRVSSAKPTVPESHVSSAKPVASESRVSSTKPMMPEFPVWAPNVPLPESGVSIHSDSPVSFILSDITKTETEVDTEVIGEATQTRSDGPRREEIEAEPEEPPEEQVEKKVEEKLEPPPEKKFPGDKYESWDSVYSGYTKYKRLSKRLKLYVQYSTAPPNSGTKPLRFKATQVSDEELTGESMNDMIIYDVADLKLVVCDPGSRHIGLRLGNDTFKIDLSEFEAVG